MYEIWVLSLGTIHCLLLYVGSSVLNVSLTLSTWIWFCVMWVTNSALEKRRMTVHVVGKLIYMACHVSIGIHLLSVSMQVRPSVFVRKEGFLLCNLDNMQSLDISMATKDVCGPGGYSTEPMRRFYPLVQDPNFPVYTVKNAHTNIRIVRKCREVGLVCFKWAVQMAEGKTERTPPAEMVERILVHDAKAIYLSWPDYDNTDRQVTMLKVQAPTGVGSPLVLIPSVSSKALKIIETKVLGVQEIENIDVEIQRGDVFIVEPKEKPLRIANMNVAMSRYCPPQLDICAQKKYGSTRHFFDIALVTQPLPFSLFATLSKCKNMIYEVCEVSTVLHILLLCLNLFVATSCLLLVHLNNKQYQDPDILVSFWIVICVLIANYIVLIYIVVMPTYRHSTMTYSGIMFVLLVAQFTYNVMELWRLDFGFNEKYITHRHESVQWVALFMNPANYYGGALFVQCLYLSIVLAWCALLKSLAAVFYTRTTHDVGASVTIFPEIQLNHRTSRMKSTNYHSLFTHTD